MTENDSRVLLRNRIKDSEITNDLLRELGQTDIATKCIIDKDLRWPKEIADELGISVSDVNNLKKRMKRLLADKESPDDIPPAAIH